MRPRAVLDMGAGLSSWIIQHTMGPEGTHHVVDTSQDWLDKARDFAKRGDGPPITAALANEWEPIEGGYDLIVHDLHGSVRHEYLPRVLNALKPGGLVVLDDAHRADYRELMVRECTKRRYQLGVLEQTTDGYGRYAALALRPQSGCSCGSPEVESTTVGYLGPDRNRYRCERCGEHWTEF